MDTRKDGSTDRTRHSLETVPTAAVPWNATKRVATPPPTPRNEKKKSRKERGVDGKEPKPSVPRTRREHNTAWKA
eukprot:scaffold436_cov336-Pavlova_lutheri.AAC.42